MSRDDTLISSSKEASLRAYVEGLGATDPAESRAPPAELVLLAADVLRSLRAPAHLAPEDLAGDLTVRLLERIRHGQDPVDGARQLAPVLKHRLRQLAIEHSPSRRVLKELSEHVRRALAHPLPPSELRPDFLERDGRFVFAEVQRAVAWARTRGDAPDEVRPLVRWLAREFDLLIELGPAPERFEDLVHQPPRTLGLPLALALRSQLSPEVLTLLRQRLSGVPLREIAEALGCSITTAHASWARAQAQLAEALLAHQPSMAEADEALALLMASGHPLAGRPSAPLAAPSSPTAKPGRRAGAHRARRSPRKSAA
jgi:DNA-directed RNA polymerase specialized sigma24 family protein